MSVNNLSFEQAATLLNALRKQATGQAAISMANEADFVSVATTTLAAGVDPIMNAISQLVGRTIFSVRPYRAKLGGIEVDSQRWGYITRKLSIADKDFTDDSGFSLIDGQAIDMYKVNKPNLLQVNFYGQNVFGKNYTIFRDQLNSAFTGSQQFGEFMTMVVQNCLDMIEQNREVVRRMTLANFMAGKIAASNGIIHALTEYNQATGSSLTAVTVYAKENFDDFCKWLYSRISTLSNLMTERSTQYQIQITGKVITRHTPVQDQKVYLYAPFLAQMNARVLADTFNQDFLRYADVEAVNYWQSIQTPDTINVMPVYLQADGSLGSPQAAVNQAKIIGVIFDRDALGVTVMNEETSTTPYNSAGRYWNVFYHFIERYWNDFTEKGAVIILD